jgi:flagellar motility protein MotE (MotC chaperone)
MKTPRLLPVVIAATTALLLLKGIGLVTSGGYVLVGSQEAQAAGAAPAPAEHGATAAGDDPTMALPPEHTLEDTSPTLGDAAPTISLGEEPAAGGHGAAPAEGEHAEALPPDPVAVAPEIADVGVQAACAPVDTAAASAEGGHGAAPAAPAEEEHGAGDAGEVAVPDCVPVPLNEHGDAVAMELNAQGMLVPVEGDATSGNDLITRLGERRDQLDAREKELEMRLALVEAAEKRIEERTAALKALEARIDALVAEKKTDEKEQFAGIVAMYETMKPKEAAVIFDALDTQMLVRVARAMNPRKMAPILARMEPQKAKALTSGLAREESEPQLDANTVEDLANLPQIVGQ